MRPAAVAAMVEVSQYLPGNPSGSHRAARDARRRLDDARDQVAAFVGADPGDVVFTSGGTEADNLAVTGASGAAGGRPACLATDHHAVLAPVEAAGGRTVGVERGGVVDLDALDALLRADPELSVVSVALANNETGVVQPIAEVAEVVRRAAPRAVLHVDAVAAAPWLDLRHLAGLVDAVSLSGHKLGGPKGIGALVVRSGTSLAPLLLGGGQERERRSGTPNLAGAVAFAIALDETAHERAEAVERVRAQCDRLLAELTAGGDHVVVTAAAEDRLPNLLHVCCRGVDREALLFRLDEEGVAASAGSSCASGALEPSHVLAAMGIPAELAAGALRLSLGWCTTEAEVDHAGVVVPKLIEDLRGSAPMGDTA